MKMEERNEGIQRGKEEWMKRGKEEVEERNGGKRNALIGEWRRETGKGGRERRRKGKEGTEEGREREGLVNGMGERGKMRRRNRRKGMKEGWMGRGRTKGWREGREGGREVICSPCIVIYEAYQQAFISLTGRA